jgi:hypothetical protein
MPLNSAHWDEMQLEQYSLKRLPEPEVEALEEHLLVCEVCRASATRMDIYVRAMRSVLARMQAEGESRNKLRLPSWLTGARMAWVLASCMLAVAAVWLQSRGVPAGNTALATVYLQAMRAVNSYGPVAPAGLPFRMKLDVGGLPASANRDAEIVDAVGRPRWKGTLAAAEEVAEGTVDARLKPGQYFVRLRSSSGELLREYGLAVR